MTAVVAIIALVVALLAIAFIIFYTFARNRQNANVLAKKKMENDYREQLLQSQIEVQEITYSAIGKELHDNVGQLLSTTKMLLGVTELNLKTIPDTLTTATKTLGDAITQLRLVSRSLDKEWLEQFSLYENLESQINTINTAGIITADLQCPEKVSMAPEEQILLFRVIQEAIQNVIKHSHAKKLSVIIEEETEMLRAQIADDGKGMAENAAGMGTANMYHRVKLFQGKINRHVHNGTIVTIELPLKPQK